MVNSISLSSFFIIKLSNLAPVFVSYSIRGTNIVSGRTASPARINNRQWSIVNGQASILYPFLPHRESVYNAMWTNS
jgi:hypothetical protein